MITIATWCWGTKYDQSYVAKFAAGVRRNLRQSHRFVVVTDNLHMGRFADEGWPIPEEDYHLLTIPGCLARLRMFDPAWQRSHGIGEGDKLVCIDLDAIVTGPLDPLFERDDGFTILQGVNSANPCKMNGSVFMLRGGAHPEVWDDFSLDAVAKVPFYSIPDDQAWFFHKMPNAGAWGPKQGVYGFMKPGWVTGNALPANARIVAFPGHRDPSQFTHLDWVKQHWR